MLTHLRAQSGYSFLRGLASPFQLVQTAVTYGMPALALTDHHSLTGAVEFFHACRASGIHPLLGLEVNTGFPTDIPGAMTGVLALYAMDLTGWRSLSRISSLLENDQATLPFGILAQEATKLICLTGGRRSALTGLLRANQRSSAEAWLAALYNLFGDSLYVELQHHTPEDDELISKQAILAHRQHLPIVASHDIHYLIPQQAHLQRVLSAIRLIRSINEVPEDACAPPDAYYLDQIEMVTRFANYPTALDNTQQIALRCQLDLPLNRPHFPEVDLPAGVTAIILLRQKAETGAHQIYGELSCEIQQRLDHELEVIHQCGYTALFLIVEEILNYARQQGIPFSSRGSAASSLVAHCIGITSPDPLRLNLYFERFLNPARATPPDIDTDICSRRRDDLIHFVYERFGEDRVATVSTINRFRSRSALREVAKAHGLPAEEVNRLADSLPHHWYGPPDRPNPTSDPYAELKEQYRDGKYQAILQDATALIGLPHHLSVHPGGVVISPGPMTDLVPTQMAAKGVKITQFDLNSIEHLGLVKIDLLGIRGLTVLGDVGEAMLSINQSTPSDRLEKAVFDYPQIAVKGTVNALSALEAIPTTDPATSDTLLQGRTIGCFQIESPGMRATLKEIHARSIDDLMVALALYRPGPLSGGLKDDFVRRHVSQQSSTLVGSHAIEQVQPYEIHPSLTPLLADTHGVILYQEQVLRIAHELAGLSLADADLLRRAMSHFDPGQQMQTLKEKFIAGAATHHAVPLPASERIWELMVAFAGYGFPKAHAASYALIAWRSAWCKTHYPALFMAAVLANWGGYYNQRIYLNEARRLGLAIRPPQVNHARQQFSVSYLDGQPVLFMGLDQVRELTRRTQGNILHERPFNSFLDFLVRVDPRPVEAENLVKVGALEGFGLIPVLLDQLKQGGWRGGQMTLFSWESSGQEDWSLAEKVAAQEEILGAGIIAHPLELASERIRSAGALTTVEAAARLGQRVRLAGMRQTWRRSNTSRGEYIYFMTLEDLEGMLDVVIFADVYQRNRSTFSKGRTYLLEGIVELDRDKGEPFIRAERIWNLD